MFDKLRKNYNILCTPSQIYVLLSSIVIISTLFQNATDPHKYCIGDHQCNIKFNNLFIFAGKVIWMIFWAIVLDSLCKNGYKRLAWILIFLPIIAMALLLLTFIFTQL